MTVRSSRLSLGESGLRALEKVQLAVSMLSAEDHRRLLRAYADAIQRLTVRDPRHGMAVEDWERD